MIRAKSINRLVEDIVATSLSTSLISSGFRYVKSNNCFKKTKQDFVQLISIWKDSIPFVYLEDEDKLYLKFSLSLSIEHPKFDKWVTKKLNIRSNFRHKFMSIDCITEVDQNLLKEGDFYEPTKSQAFKEVTFRSLVGPDNKARKNITDLPDVLAVASNRLDELSDVTNIFEQRTSAYRDYYRLLVYYGNDLKAKQYYTKSISESKDRIVKNLDGDPKELKEAIQGLEIFAEECNTLLGLDIEVDFDRSFKKIECEKRRISLSDTLGYEEIITLDASLLNIDSFAIDNEGNTCAIIDEYNIILINNSGIVSVMGTLDYPDCFRRDIGSIEVEWNKVARAFVINNYILKNNELVELPIQLNNKKFKVNSLFPILSDLIFDSEKKQYLTLYSSTDLGSILSVYNDMGDLLENSILEGNCRRINFRRREILRLNKDNSYESIDFKGNLIGKFPYGNGNDKLELSNSGNEIVLHSYATKSQFYSLDRNKKQTLWAHPTFVKGYKEKFYSDINHNFGMTICKFSPNDEILIGGADHGKYVLWDGTGKNRKELIPSDKSRTVFNYFHTIRKNGISSKEYYVPYTENIDSNQYFVNRGYSVNQIDFIDNDIFLLKIKDAILAWDYKGNSIGFVYGLEKCAFSESNYMVLHQENQLCIFRRKSNLDENFKNSIFKDIEKNELNSNIVSVTVSDKEIEESASISHIKSSTKDEITKEKISWFKRLFKRKDE